MLRLAALTLLVFLATNSRLVAQKYVSYYSGKYGKERIESCLQDLSREDLDSMRNLLKSIPLRLSVAKFRAEYYSEQLDSASWDYMRLLGYLTFYLIEKGEDVAYQDHYNLAWVQQLGGEYKEAISELTKSISQTKNPESYPTIASMKAMRGECKFYVSDYYGAISDLTEALKIDSTSVQNYLYRGRSYGSIGKFQEALLDFSKAIKLDDDNAVALYYRGITYLSMKNLERACLDFSRAGELGLDIAYEKIREECNK